MIFRGREKPKIVIKDSPFFSKAVRIRGAKIADSLEKLKYKWNDSDNFFRYYWGIERFDKKRYKVATMSNLELRQKKMGEIVRKAEELSEFYEYNPALKTNEYDGGKYAHAPIIDKKYSRSVISKIGKYGTVIGGLGYFVGVKAKYLEPFARDAGQFVSDALDYIHLGLFSPIGTAAGNFVADMVKYAGANVDEILRTGVTAAIISFVFHVRSRIKMGRFRDGKNAISLLKKQMEAAQREQVI